MRAAAILGLAALAAGLSQTPAPPRPPQPPATLKAGQTAIFGRVLEANSTTPVAGASVFLSGSPLGVPTTMFTNGVPGGARTVEADAQGYFVFRDLPPGGYRLTVSASGFVDAAIGDRRPLLLPTRSRFDFSPGLQLVDTDRIVNVSLNMWRLGGITGRVVDEAGEAVVGAPISVVLKATVLPSAPTDPVAAIMTDDRGIYHADVAPGDYYVALLAPMTTVPATAVDGFVQAQREGGAVMQEYLREVQANGSVLPRGVGARVGRFMVTQFGTRNAWVVRPPSIDGDGMSFYPTTFHPAGSSRASASVVRVTSGEELAGIDIQLRPVPSRTLSGHAVGPAGASASNLALYLMPAEVATTGLNLGLSQEAARALADGNGDFTFLGVAPGTYLIAGVRRPAPAGGGGRGGGGVPLEWFADTVSIGDKDVTNLSIALKSSGRISGRVVVDGTAPLLAPNVLATLSFTVTPGPGSVGAWVAAGGVARLDESNRFTVASITPGSYVVRAGTLPPGWIVKSITMNGRDALDRLIEVTAAGEAADAVVVTLTNHVTVVTGAVRYDDGREANDVRVIIFPADKAVWPLANYALGRVGFTLTRDGRFLIRGLAPGEYLAAAVGSPEAQLADERTLATLSRLATPLTIGDGENKTLDLRVVVVR